MKLKVLVISNYSDIVSSRPEAEAMIGLHNAGIQVDIMTKPGAEYNQRFREQGMRVIEYYPDKKYSKTAVKRIREELDKEKYDILHLFTGRAIKNGIRAAKGRDVKVALYRGYAGNIHWYDPMAYCKSLHPRVDKIWCVSNHTRNLLQQNSLFSKNKAIRIHKGHDINWYSHVTAIDLRQELKIPGNAFVGVCAANARPMKGIPYLVRATQFLPAKFPFHLILIGNGMDAPEIKKEIENSPIKQHIHLTGFRKDALRFIKAANVFVLASIKGEALTKAVIESMCLGTTPIITAIGGNRDLVINNKHGLVVPPKKPKAIADALVKLYENPDLTHKLAQNAKQHIKENFNLQTTIQELKAMYQDLIR